MSEWWDPAEVKEKKNRYLSRKDKASVSLGGCSIISILLALSITSSFIPNFNASGSGWGLVFIFFIVPLMIFSFAMSSLGICLNSGTRAGKKTLYNCICPYFFSNLNDQNYWMDAGEMIHGSVDTLPHKGHKRMFFIHARRSLLAHGGINNIIYRRDIYKFQASK